MNQDAVLAGPTVFAVADGMGGHAAGDVASSLAVATLARTAGDGPIESVETLVAAVQRANVRILAEAHDDQDGMGTTLAAVAIVGSAPEAVEELALVNVGDSLIYRLDPTGSLTQLSVDHSVVAELLASGDITADEAEHHPERNAITRALGLYEGIDVDQWLRVPELGERYLLCSDGLVHEVADDEIASVLLSGTTASAAAEQLVTLAVDRGATDNVSVVVVDVVDAGAPSAAEQQDAALLGVASSDTLPRE